MDSHGPARRTPRLAHLWTIGAALAGAMLAGGLIAECGIRSVATILSGAGFGILGLVLFHVVQLWLTAVGWRALMPAKGTRPSPAMVTVLRMIREGINTLLPTAQVGGLVVSVRLLTRWGVAPAAAVAATVADVTVELVTQVVFVMLGLAMLVYLLGALPFAVPLVSGLGVFAAMVVALIAAQRFGLARLGLRVAARFGWARQVDGVQAAIMDVYREPAALARSAALHLLAWSLGAVEVGLALHFLGHDTGLEKSFVIESLGQTVKAAGFAIPGALGIQEGGYVVLCGLFGIAPDVALALSLVKRLRELILGAPSIALWLRMERLGGIRSAPPSMRPSPDPVVDQFADNARVGEG